MNLIRFCRAVVLAYNVPGLDELILTRADVVGIFNGSIQWWNDTRIAQSNKHAPLPRKRIKVVARSDQSGTTEIFTSALSSFDSSWNSSYGTFRLELEYICASFVLVKFFSKCLPGAPLFPGGIHLVEHSVRITLGPLKNLFFFSGDSPILWLWY